MKTKLFMAASAVAIMFASAASAQEAASFQLVNDSEHELITLQTSGSSDPSWGEDVLDGTAAPGATIHVDIPDTRMNINVERLEQTIKDAMSSTDELSFEGLTLGTNPKVLFICH